MAEYVRDKLSGLSCPLSETLFHPAVHGNKLEAVEFILMNSARGIQRETAPGELIVILIIPVRIETLGRYTWPALRNEDETIRKFFIASTRAGMCLS